MDLSFSTMIKLRVICLRAMIKLWRICWCTPHEKNKNMSIELKDTSYFVCCKSILQEIEKYNKPAHLRFGGTMKWLWSLVVSCTIIKFFRREIWQLSVFYDRTRVVLHKLGARNGIRSKVENGVIVKFSSCIILCETHSQKQAKNSAYISPLPSVT